MKYKLLDRQKKKMLETWYKDIITDEEHKIKKWERIVGCFFDDSSYTLKVGVGEKSLTTENVMDELDIKSTPKNRRSTQVDINYAMKKLRSFGAPAGGIKVNKNTYYYIAKTDNEVSMLQAKNEKRLLGHCKTYLSLMEPESSTDRTYAVLENFIDSIEKGLRQKESKQKRLLTLTSRRLSR